MEGIRGFAPDARWVTPESLHITLKFIGEQREPTVEQIKHALGSIHCKTTEIHFQGFGFFPTPKSARVFWLGMGAGSELASLASAIDATTASFGIPKEDRAFSPHLTLARAGRGSGSPRWQKGDGPHRIFQHLQAKLAAFPAPDFGTMTPRDFFLYQSQLSPKGSKYTKLVRFALAAHD